MKTRLLSVLLVFLLIASVSIPAVSAGNPVDDIVKAVADGAKNAIDYTHGVIKEVTEVNKRVITDPDMRSVHLRTAAGTASGATGGPAGAAAGCVIGTLEGYGEKMIEATT